MLRSAVVVLAIILFVHGTAASKGGGREIPFPVGKTTILRQEKVRYVVEGRVRIKEGIEITCLRDVYIVGKGKDAVIEVEGKFKVHGVGAREVIFENVAVEVLPNFDSIHMDMAIFRKGASVRTVPDKPAAGKRFFLQMVDFKEDATLNLDFNDGQIQLRSVCSDKPVTIRGFTPEGKKENKVKLFCLGCAEGGEHPGLVGGLIVENVYDVTIRINRLGGEKSEFKGCRVLFFEGNKVTSKSLLIEQTALLDFRKTKFNKCDLYCDKVTVKSAPGEDKERDNLFVDRCWFKGILDPDRVRKEILTDGADDEKNVAEVKLGKLGKRPLELAGPWIR
jgi:hypothetical protein